MNSLNKSEIMSASSAGFTSSPLNVGFGGISLCLFSSLGDFLHFHGIKYHLHDTLKFISQTQASFLNVSLHVQFPTFSSLLKCLINISNSPCPNLNSHSYLSPTNSRCFQGLPPERTMPLLPQTRKTRKRKSSSHFWLLSSSSPTSNFVSCGEA